MNSSIDHHRDNQSPPAFSKQGPLRQGALFDSTAFDRNRRRRPSLRSPGVWPGPKPIEAKMAIQVEKPEEAMAIQYQFGFKHSLAPRVLATKGHRADEHLDKWLNPSLSDIPDPCTMLNFKEAIELFYTHLASENPTIKIHSDYDADGLTANAQITHFCRQLGIPVYPKVPNRQQHGYGLSRTTVEREHCKHGSGLLICLDIGTNSIEQIKAAQGLGDTVCVWDHHVEGQRKCNADLLVNPEQQGCKYAGNVLPTSGLINLKINHMNNSLAVNDRLDMTRYLELDTIGIIADVSCLKGPAWIQSRIGMSHIKNSSWPVLRQMLKNRKAPLSSRDIAFQVAPMINAPGRLDDANFLVNGLTVQDEKQAQQIVSQIDALNVKRKEILYQMEGIALDMLSKLDTLPPVIMLESDHFHAGVVGILCSRLTELYHRPALLFSRRKENELVGSGRSVPGFNLVSALKESNELFLKVGGHPAAAGASLVPQNFKPLQEKLTQHILNVFGSTTQPHTYYGIDCTFSDLTEEAVLELYHLEPFGRGNEEPLVVVRDVQVINTTQVGRHKEHLRLELKHQGKTLAGMLWKRCEHPALKKGATVDIIASPLISPLTGEVELEIKPTGCAI